MANFVRKCEKFRYRGIIGRGASLNNTSKLMTDPGNPTLSQESVDRQAN